MAAGFARHLGGNRVGVFSGGSEPVAAVNSAAVAAMAEVGVDISEATSSRWTDEVVAGADVVVTMGCGDVCPFFVGVHYQDWPLLDPARRSIAEVRLIREQIRSRVTALLESLGVLVEESAD